MSEVHTSLEDLIRDLRLRSDPSTGITPNLLTIALVDALKEESVPRIECDIRFSSIKANKNSKACIAIFMHTEITSTLSGWTAEGNTPESPDEVLFVEGADWVCTELEDTCQSLRNNPAYNVARAIIQAGFLRLDSFGGDKVQPDRPRSSMRL